MNFSQKVKVHVFERIFEFMQFLRDQLAVDEFGK